MKGVKSKALKAFLNWTKCVDMKKKSYKLFQLKNIIESLTSTFN